MNMLSDDGYFEGECFFGSSAANTDVKDMLKSGLTGHVSCIINSTLLLWYCHHYDSICVCLCVGVCVCLCLCVCVCVFLCLYRFSTFAKTGGEAFLMGQDDVHVPESDRIRIIVRNGTGCLSFFLFSSSSSSFCFVFCLVFFSICYE